MLCIKIVIDVKSRFLLFKNDFKFQLGFKVVVKKGTNKQNKTKSVNH